MKRKGRPGPLRVLQAFRGVTTARAGARKPGKTTYLVPVELPELEPEPMLPLLDPLLDGVLGEVVELGELVLLLPLAPELDLLKYESHS